MSATTGIAWTEATWNPVRGCSPISAGCANCYAARMASRFSGPGQPYEGLAKGGKWTGEVRFLPEMLDLPLHWRKPRRVFVNSMSDLFADAVTDRQLREVWSVMGRTTHHSYQVLTKRPERMRTFLSRWGEVFSPLPNVWLGVSVEDRSSLHRIDTLCEVEAALRFVSFEPVIDDLGQLDLTGIDWVIIGGETGPGARPCKIKWIRAIVRQAKAQNVRVFVKQLGAAPMWLPSWSRSRPRGGVWDRPEDWPDDLRLREMPGPR